MSDLTDIIDKYPFLNKVVQLGDENPDYELYKNIEISDSIVPFRHGIIDGTSFYWKQVPQDKKINLMGIRAPKPSGDHASKTFQDLTPESAQTATTYLNNYLFDGESIKQIDMILYKGNDFNKSLALLFVDDVCINKELVSTFPFTADNKVPSIINLNQWQTYENTSTDIERSDTASFFDDVEALGLDDESILDSKEPLGYFVKIGLTHLPTTLDSIRVVEQHANREAKTIRTPGSPVIKTSQLNKRIEITATFPSVDSMNNILRPIMAQFIRSPFLPIENHHLRKLIYGEMAFDPNKYSETAKNRKFGHVSEVHADLESENAYIADTKLYYKLVNEEYKKEIAKGTRKAKDILMSEIKNKVLTQHNELFHPAPDQELLPLLCSYEEITIATTPGFVGVVQVTMVLDVFNFSAYVPKIKYFENDADAIRSGLYYNSMNLHKYPDNFTDNPDYSSYNVEEKGGVISLVNNISKSKPFKKYILPLLTGRAINIKAKDLVMHKKDGSIETKDHEYTFWPTFGWLRPIRKFDDFKKFKWYIDLTDLTRDQTIEIRKQVIKSNNSIISKIKILARGLIRPSTGKVAPIEDIKHVLGGMWDFAFDGFELFYGGPMLESKYNTILDSTTGQYFFVMKYDIEYSPLVINYDNWVTRDENGEVKRNVFGRVVQDENDPIRLVKGKEYSLDQIKRFFERVQIKDPDTGRIIKYSDIVDQIKVKLEGEDALRYGETTRYNFDWSENEDTVVTGMAASLRNNVAELSLESHNLSTKQFMGRGNWSIQMNMQTRNENFVTMLSDISGKAVVSTGMRELSGSKSFMMRNTALNTPAIPGYNTFFSFLGIHKVLIESFEYDTIDEKPGWWNISLRFIQADLDITEYEKLLLWGRYYDKDMLDKIRTLFMKHYGYHSTLSGGTGYVMKTMRDTMLTILRNFGYGNNQPDYQKERLEGKETYKDSLEDVEKIEKILKDPLNIGLFEELPVLYNEDKNIKTIYNGLVSDLSKRQLIIDEVTKLYKGIINHNYIRPDGTKTKIVNVAASAAGTITGPLGPLVQAGVRAIYRYIGADEPNIAEKWVLDIDKRLASPVYGLDRGKGSILPVIKIIKIAVTQAIQNALLYDRQGIIQFLKRHSDTDWEKRINESFIPKDNDFYSNVQLYGSYPDLELPLSASNILFSPTFYMFRPTIANDSRRDAALADVVQNNFINMYQQSSAFQHSKALDIMLALQEKDPDGPTKFIEKLAGVFNGDGIMENTIAKYEKSGKSQLSDDDAKKWVDVFGKLKNEFKETNLGDVFDREINEDRLLELFQYHDLYQRNSAFKRNMYVLKQVLYATAQGERSGYFGGVVKDNDNLYQMVYYLSNAFNISQLSDPDIENWGVYRTYTAAQLLRIYNRIKIQQDSSNARGDLFNMDRAFPAFKFFIIEDDAKEWGMIDDYYLYNSVEKISVVSSKNSASKVATIRLTNLTGNLSKQAALFDTEKVDRDQTTDEQKVKNTMLREGAQIMIKAGYQNNPMFLDTIFIGRIVSVQLNDVVEIHAQSFGASLLERPYGGELKKFGGLKNIHTQGDVLTEVFKGVKGLSDLGTSSMWDSLGFFRNDADVFYAPRRVINWKTLIEKFNPLDFYIKFETFNPIFENIYFPFTDSPVFTEIMNMANSILFLDNKYKPWSFNWIIENQSIWDIMNQMALHHPNYIVTTLIYNDHIPGKTRETIYIGPKTGYYKYTDQYDYISGGEKIQTRILKHKKDKIQVSKDYEETFELDWRFAFIEKELNAFRRFARLFGKLKTKKLFDFLRNSRNFIKVFGDPLYQFAKKMENAILNLSEGGIANDSTILSDVLKKWNLLWWLDNDPDSEKNKLLKRGGDTLPRLKNVLNHTIDFFDEYLFVIDPVDFDNNLTEFRTLAKQLKPLTAPFIDDKIHSNLNYRSLSPTQLFKYINKVSGELEAADFSIYYERDVEGGMVLKSEVSGPTNPMAEYFYNLIELKEFLNEYSKPRPNIQTNKDLHNYIFATDDNAFDDREFSSNKENVRVLESLDLASKAENSNLKYFYLDNPTDLVDENEQPYAGYAPVVNYHYVDTYNHIIQNNIRASSEEMSNKVILKFPERGKTTFKYSSAMMADDDIAKYKTYVSEQSNINPSSFLGLKTFSLNAITNWKFGFPQEYIVGTNILCRQMAPMYRGELALIGMPGVKPWDVMYINDIENDIWGPIEVESVVHQIDENGFRTIITPNAIVEPLDPEKRWEVESNGMIHNIMKFGGDLMYTGAQMAASIAIQGIGAAGQSAKFQARKYRKSISKAGYITTKRARAKIIREADKLAIETGNIHSVFGKNNEIKKDILYHIKKRVHLRVKEVHLANYKRAIKLTNRAVDDFARNKVINKWTFRGASMIGPTHAAGTDLGSKYNIENHFEHILKTFTNIQKWASIGIPLATGIPVIGGGVAVLGLTLGIASAVAGSQVVSWIAGEKLGRECIDIIGLVQNGKPFVAGVEGMQKNTMETHFVGKLMKLLDLGNN